MKTNFYISKISFLTVFILSLNTLKVNAQDSLYLIGTITGVSHEKRITDVKGIGDVNGDGYGDFIVTSYNDDKSATIYLGSYDLNLIPDLIFHYPVNGDLVRDFGIAAGIRDVNGDGYDDFLIKGAFDYFEKGKCFLYLGGETIDTIPVAEFSEHWIQDFFGQTMEGVGDINKDGYDDFIIGSPYNWTNGTGYVYLFWGGDTISFSKCDTLQGYISGDQFGRSVANIGDINNDGFDDLAVGAPFSIDTAKVYIFYYTDQLDADADIIISSKNVNYDEFGKTIKRGGDLNNDGIIDFFIGSWEGLYLYMSIDSSIIINGTMYLEADGDINNDGHPDFVVGDPNYLNSSEIITGAAYIYLGSDSIDTNYTYKLEGEDESVEFSSTMFFSDINGDGYDEFFILSPGYPHYENSLGKIYIYSYVKIVDVENDKNALPKNFELNQNYPNPFNPSTTISYTLPFQSSVELTIFDLLGNDIKSFNISSQSAGYQNILWDGRNENGNYVSSGIYLYRINIKSLENNEMFSKTAKLMMLK